MDSSRMLAPRETGREAKGAVQKMAGAVVKGIQRKRTEAESRLQRRQIVHLARVAILGEFSSALTHELRQPLASIRCDALAAQHLIAAKREELPEMCEILEDIIAADKRAEEIIQRMRSLVKRRDPSVDLPRDHRCAQGTTLGREQARPRSGIAFHGTRDGRGVD